MNFEELIETLSKGSATAVTTLESNTAELEGLKAYLYVQTPVEQALRAEIDRNLKKPRVIFVGGSAVTENQSCFAAFTLTMPRGDAGRTSPLKNEAVGPFVGEVFNQSVWLFSVQFLAIKLLDHLIITDLAHRSIIDES